MISRFHRYLHLSDPTQFRWDMGPSMQAHSVHARKLACSCQIMCSERSGMIFWFHIYFDLSDFTKFGWYIGLCMQAHSMHACKLACLGWSMCSERLGLFSWFHRYFHLSDLTQFGWGMGLWTQAHSLHAWVKILAQRGPECSPDSIDTLISLIRTNLRWIDYTD